MRQIILTSVIVMSLLSSAFAQKIPTELQTPEIVSLGRMPMRASGFGFENRELAKTGEREKSNYFLSLNGIWKFNWVQDPQKRPLDFFELSFNDQSWDNFQVPANWEVNGDRKSTRLNSSH